MTAIGSHIGPYRIVSMLGEGGMGQVFRATDTKLGRDVAIKVLPPDLSRDSECRARFEREARLLAALHHPNIATIFGVDDSSGVVAIVMELVEGPTLAECLEHGPIIGKQAVAIARQLADALDAAHEKGIVHRDLKPANIKLMADGTVKVLDFGLATALQSGVTRDEDVTRPLLSQPGGVVGTPAYMSPEQARGLAVDKRTDIWAYGCVLFELLAGRPPFTGATSSDVMANVLQQEPDYSALPAATPPALRRIITRCLEKDPRRRLRDIGDVGAELDAPQPAVVPARDESGGGATAAWLAAIVFVAAITGIAVWRLRPPPVASSAPQTFDVEPLTNDSGFTGQPALSPDGRLIAYASDRSGRGDLDIWVQQTTGGVPLRVTDYENDDSHPDFSPDGNQIVFRSERDGGGVYVVPALGGPARLIASEGHDPRFSPDGSRIAYWSGVTRGEVWNRASAAFIVSLAGGAPTRLMSGFAVATMPVWSPDGRSLLVMAAHDRDHREQFDWWLAPADGSAPTPTGVMNWQDLRSSAGRQNTVWPGHWTSSGLLLANGAQILRLPLSASTGRLTGDPVRIVSGVGNFGTPAGSRGDDLVVSSFSQLRTIEQLPLGGDAERATRVFQDNNNVGWRASASRDGALVVFERAIGARREIWRKNMTSGEERLILPVPTQANVNATVSPDASRLTYVIPDSAPDVGKGFVVEIAGGVPRPVCDRCTIWGFSPDSRHAIVTDRKSVRLVADNGVAQTVITVPAGSSDIVDRPVVAPDGHAIAFRVQQRPGGKTFVGPLSSSGPVPQQAWNQVEEPTTSGRPCGWSPDSSTLYLLLDTDGFRDLWAQKVDGAGRTVRKPFVVRHLHHTTGVSTSLANAITPQGFLYEATRLTGNLWRLAPQAAK